MLACGKPDLKHKHGANYVFVRDPEEDARAIPKLIQWHRYLQRGLGCHACEVADVSMCRRPWARTLLHEWCNRGSGCPKRVMPDSVGASPCACRPRLVLSEHPVDTPSLGDCSVKRWHILVVHIPCWRDVFCFLLLVGAPVKHHPAGPLSGFLQGRAHRRFLGAVHSHLARLGVAHLPSMSRTA